MQIVRIAGHDPGPLTGSGSNTYLIAGKVPTLIDTASGSPRHLDELATAVEDGASALDQVLVTHAHPDHAGGAPAVAGRWPATVFRKYPWPAADVEYAVPWVALRPDEQISAGDGTLWAVHTPGHAPDHICFFDVASGDLFGGDLVVSGGTIVIPATAGGSVSQYLDSLRRVLELHPRRILPGHGDPIDQPAELIRGYIAHRLSRERQIVTALAKGPLAIDAIVALVYPDLASDLEGAAAESVLAHLLKLRDDGRARVDDGSGREQPVWRLLAGAA